MKRLFNFLIFALFVVALYAIPYSIADEYVDGVKVTTGDRIQNPTITGATITTSDMTAYDYDPLPIAWGINGASAPEACSILSSTKKVEVRNFDDASDEGVYFTWEVPPDLTGSTITFRVITWITNATGPSNEGVSFFLQGASIGDGELLSKAHGTAIESNWTGGTHAQYDRVATSWSGNVTIADLAASETAMLYLYRDVSDASDDYAQDIGVAIVQIKYSRVISGN